MISCNWVEHCSPACKERAEHANLLWDPIHDATVRVAELIRLKGEDQGDLFAPQADVATLEEWQGIHKAVGDEYRRRSAAFWKECPNG